ncbi:MAG: hypothetical protein R6W76_01570, partial [Caldilinea sp.]
MALSVIVFIGLPFSISSDGLSHLLDGGVDILRRKAILPQAAALKTGFSASFVGKPDGVVLHR